MVDPWPLPQNCPFAQPIHYASPTGMIPHEWPSGIHRIIRGLSPLMPSWFVNYWHGIVLRMNTCWTNAVGAYLFLGVCTFLPTCNSRDRSSSLSFCPILQSPNRSRGAILHYGSFRPHRHSISRCTRGSRSLYRHGNLLFEKHWDIGAVSHQRTRSSRSIIFLQGRGSPVHQEARWQRFSVSPASC